MSRNNHAESCMVSCMTYSQIKLLHTTSNQPEASLTDFFLPIQANGNVGCPSASPPSHWDLQPVQQRLNSRRMSSLRWVTTFKTLLVQQLQDVLDGIFSNCTLANAQNKQNPNKLLQYGVRIHNVLTSFQRLVLTQMWFPVKQNLIANHKHICRLILSLMQHFIRGGNKIRPLEFQRNF